MAKYILKRTLSEEQRQYSKAINDLIKGAGSQWNKKNAISVTLDKSEELARELGERVRRGIMSAKAAKARLSRVRSASNSRIDLLRNAANRSQEARNVNYVKPAGPILARLENFARTGAAFHGQE